MMLSKVDGGLTEDIDKEIYSYLNLNNPKSFLLYAGAGSGKTRTLVNVLQELRSNDLQRLIKSGQRVAIITYTNAACNEIKHRLQFDPIFSVSTIHSFAWGLIESFTEDIREWLAVKLSADIDDLETKLSKARDPNGKTALKNAESRDKKKRRLAELKLVTQFVYSPDGNKLGKGALNHAEVISIVSNFVSTQPLMQKIVVNSFPILLIDESQDTNKDLLDAFINTQQNNKTQFCLGLFGDMMQRIYGGGKPDLDRTLPDDWKVPEKNINHRCPKRVVTLINEIRKNVDQHEQKPRLDALNGAVKLFIINSNVTDKSSIEQDIRDQMHTCTDDEMWLSSDGVKCLTLEHAMAAKRGGFVDFFLPLQGDEKLKDSVLNGNSSEIKFITNQVLPLIHAVKANDDFEIANVIKKYSPVLALDNTEFIKNPIDQIRLADRHVDELRKLLDEQVSVSFINILKLIHTKNLLNLPDKFIPHLLEIDETKGEHEEDAELESEESRSWGKALNANLEHVELYAKYIADELGFGTHQGVKGLEFDRVMVVLDDEEANGFLFSYEKLFGAKVLTKKDLENEAEGQDSSRVRTRRLFYVTCSRAKTSLAVVAYTKEPMAVKQHALESGWFDENEVVLI